MNSKVETAVESALLIAWDGCHKIYVAMDDETADWFSGNYEHVYAGRPQAMSIVVKRWYRDSCGLRFISAVSYNETDPNAGYVDLVPQFAGEGA